MFNWFNVKFYSRAQLQFFGVLCSYRDTHHTSWAHTSVSSFQFFFFPFPTHCLWHTHAGQMCANVSVYFIHKTWYVCWYARLPDRFCCSFRTTLAIFIKTGTDSEWVRSTIWMVLFFTFGRFRYFLLLRDILYLFVALTRWHWNYYCFYIGIFYVCASCVIRLSLYLSVCFTPRIWNGKGKSCVCSHMCLSTQRATIDWLNYFYFIRERSCVFCHTSNYIQNVSETTWKLW